MNEQPITPSAPTSSPPNGGSWRGASSAPTNPPPNGESWRGASNEGSWRGAAIFPGSFDPFTIGHADIVRRGLALFDRIVIAVGYNAQKASATAVADRVAAIERWAATLPEAAPAALSAGAANDAAISLPRIKVVSYSDLTVDLAQREGARFLLRGVRSVKDFEYERDLAAINAALTPTAPTAPASPAMVSGSCAAGPLETVLLIADPRYAHISSSLVRELASYGRDVTPYLP